LSAPARSRWGILPEIVLSSGTDATGLATRDAASLTPSGSAVIDYTSSLDGIETRYLQGFFVGWPHPRSPSACSSA
jgi:hypothetical protein